jgi:GLPGLI family protein
LFGLVALGLIDCKQSHAKFIDEGVIEYDAKVVDKKHPLADLAPTKMSVKFKENKFLAEMSTMGLFNTSIIIDNEKKSLIQTIKIFDIKNATIQDEKSVVEENQEFELKLNPTKETKVIAGYLCKKYIASFVKEPNKTFEVYFTDELDIKTPNIMSPYNQIPGMLMQYRLKRFGLEMEFTATKVYQEDIKNDAFDLPSSYKVVSKEEMRSFLENI